MSQKPVVAEQSASFAHAAPHVCDTEHIGVGEEQSMAVRQSTHECETVSQRWGAWQSPSTLHSTQTPALQTPPIMLQSLSFMQVDVQVCVVGSHTGDIMGQSRL